MKAKKSLGQHFLHTESVRDAIVDASELSSNDTVLEIGPGEGFLTGALLATGARVVAVEKDTALVRKLSALFEGEVESGALTLVSEDVRTFDTSKYGLKDGAYKLVANIPYYITGEILRRFIGGTPKPSRAVLLIQREVAERIVAKGERYGILSHSIHAYGTPSIVRIVKAGSFRPAPKVDSAILLIENISRNNFSSDEEEKLFFTLIKSAFAHPRKQVLGNIPEEYRERLRAELHANNLPETARAETIPLSVWHTISS